MAYLGIFFFLKKQSRIVRQEHTTVPMSSSLNERRQEREGKMERKFATTSFLILLFLIISLNELKKSCAIVLGSERQVNETIPN